MVCKYCGHQKKLIKAHIIPESFFRRLREGQQPPLLVRQNHHVRRSPIGIYDPNMLCAECDAIFAPWDDHAQQVLSPQLSNALVITHGERTIAWAVKDYRYDFLKLFFISLLWRASVTQHPFYHRINLGPLDAKVRPMIAKADPGPFSEFGVVLARFDDAQLGSAMLDPHPTKIDGLNYCQFLLGRYVAWL